MPPGIEDQVRVAEDEAALANPEQALDLIKSFLSKVKKTGGIFIPLWHNSSLCDEGEWKGWRDVYEGMLAKASELVRMGN
jgi:hypothetical protein